MLQPKEEAPHVFQQIPFTFNHHPDLPISLPFRLHQYSPQLFGKDRTFFHQQPYVVSENGRYTLRWQYGDLGCVFFPESKVAAGELQFYLTVSTSSGCMAGRPGMMEVEIPEQVRAIEGGNVYWLEPDGSKIKLEVRY